MKPLLHLIRKDLRYVGRWLGLTWLIWALVAFYPIFTRTIPATDQPKVLMPLFLVGWVMALLTQTHLIHLDPVVGAPRFLATRPVPRGREIASKLTLVALGIVVPIVCFKMLMVAFYSLGLSAKDYLLLGVSELVFVSTICSVMLLAAIFTRKLGTTILILAGSVVIFWLFLVATQWNGVHLMFGIDIDDAIDLNTSRRFLFQLALILFSCWTVVGFVVTRRWVQPAFAFLFLVIASVSAYFWNVNFVRWLSDPPLEAPKAEWPDLSRARGFSVDKVSVNQGFLFKPLLLTASNEGVPEPWYLRELSYESVATFSDGSVLSGSSPFYRAFGFDLLRLQAMAAKRFGHARPEGHRSFNATSEVEIFRDLPKGKKGPTTIAGEVLFQARRPVILDSLPLKVGASVLTQRTRYTIRAIYQREDHIEVILSIEGLWLTLSGNMPGYFTGDIVFLALDDQGTAWLNFNNRGISRSALGNLTLEQQRLTVQYRGDSPAGLKLLIVGTEAGGDVTIPFRVTKELR